MTAQPATDTDADLRSVTALIAELVQTPSRGGLDPYGPVVDVVEGWMGGAGLRPKVLTGASGPVAVLCEVEGDRPGPHYVLDACLDTADIGDPTAWTHGPYSADVEGGWLYGRGSSDSKAAVAIFSHLAARLAADPTGLAGRLSVLFDLDEHTGGFGGIRAFLDTPAACRVDGVMIGYPGPDKVVIGGRGFLRVRVTVFGQADHSASGKSDVANAIVKAAHLIDLLQAAVPTAVDPAYGLPPKLTVTSVRGGTSGAYSVVPDRCELEVDVRLTSVFDAAAAWSMLRNAVKDLDRLCPAPRASKVEATTESWPPFRLPAGHELPAAIRAGARMAGLDPAPVVAGPSNIGNFLAARGIPATAGFGVRYRGLHGTDEAIELASVPAVGVAYEHAVRRLLASDR